MQVGEAVVSWFYRRVAVNTRPFQVIANTKPGYFDDLKAAVEAAHPIYMEGYSNSAD